MLRHFYNRNYLYQYQADRENPFKAVKTIKQARTLIGLRGHRVTNALAISFYLLEERGCMLQAEVSLLFLAILLL